MYNISYSNLLSILCFFICLILYFNKRRKKEAKKYGLLIIYLCLVCIITVIIISLLVLSFVSFDYRLDYVQQFLISSAVNIFISLVGMCIGFTLRKSGNDDSEGVTSWLML